MLVLYRLFQDREKDYIFVYKGNITIIYKIDFFRITSFSLPAGGLLSHSRLRGTQGTRLYTTVQVWVPAGLRGVALVVQSREILQVTTGSLSDQLEPTRPMHPRPKKRYCFVFHLPVLLCLE